MPMFIPKNVNTFTQMRIPASPKVTFTTSVTSRAPKGTFTTSVTSRAPKVTTTPKTKSTYFTSSMIQRIHTSKPGCGSCGRH